MAGYGTGRPISFKCAKEARRHYRIDGHEVTLTGRTKPRRKDGNLHPRMSTVSREYRCSCGHVGWSTHADLERFGKVAP